MKKGRAPVIVDVLFSLEWFILVAVSLTPFLYFYFSLISADPMPLMLKIALCSVAYVFVALATRTEKFTALRLIVPVLAVAGCVLMGQNILEYIILGVVGVMAAGCGLMIYFRLEQGSQTYSGMFFLIGLLVVMAVIAQMLEMPYEAKVAASTWVAIFSALYLPMCIASNLLLSLQDALCIFKGRSEQPVTPVKSRITKVIAVCAVLVFVLLMVLPQFGGASLLSNMFVGSYYLGLSAFATLFSVLAKPGDIDGIEEMVESGQESLPPLEEAPWQTWLGLAFVIAAFTPLFIWLICVVFRFIKNSILSLLGRNVPVKEKFNARYDTVEKLEAVVQVKEDKRTAKSNAAKVRRIYRKRITSILGRDRDLRNSLTPAEIVRLCRKHGEDVTELTRLYHKARYTQACTDEDVKAAQKL